VVLTTAGAWPNVRAMVDPSSDSARPRFSVIVPTIGRASLSVTLASLAGQSLPRERFEVIVAFDGAASDEALAAAARAGAKVVKLAGRRGPGAARNAAAHEAQGEILAFTEDDCVPDRDWLAHAARRFEQEPGLDVLDGFTLLPDGRPVRRGDGPFYLPTNLFVRRATFTRAGGYCEDFFDPASGLYFREDSDLGFALEAGGARVLRDRTVTVIHPAEHARFLDPLRWARRYVMDPLLARRHPEQFAERIEVVRLGAFQVRRPFVRACVLAVIGLTVAGAGAAFAKPPIAVTGALVTIAAWLALWAKWKFDPRRLPLVPIVPFVLLGALAAGERRAARLLSGQHDHAR